MFHSVHGEWIELLNDNKTAQRNRKEFNHGLVFSSEPLKNNYLFEIRIGKQVYSWNGGLEIGVTKCDPEDIVIPANASDLQNGTWILSGTSVLKDGRSVRDIYGLDLSSIKEGDVIGVMKTDQDELIFSLNGIHKGIAAYHIPSRVFLVLDLYGQTTEASVVSYSLVENIQISTISSDLDMLDDFEIAEGNSVLSNLVSNFDHQTTLVPASEDDISPIHPTPSVIPDKIRCGALAKITSSGRSAERRRPVEEFNNGVVITHRPLLTNELYEIRIDRLIEKWSGSIEVGITMHNPDFLEFPPTMTNLKSGTVMMSGCGILTNGKATKRDYGDYNLDDLSIGDRIGLVRKSSGDLHYTINGLDQGVAASNIPVLFWGVVDLYGRTVKVTVVDRDDINDQAISRKMSILHGCHLVHNLVEMPDEESQSLLFHKKCGHYVTVINGCRTAYRANALEDFNNGVVLTNRPLRINEPFEVILDKVAARWAGSIEIGVTSHSPVDLDFPTTMTNIRTGTWMMTGNGVMHNGITVLDDYGINLDRLQAGDRVGVVINDGILHLYVNGIDQGEVKTNITTPMYGVIDLYGQAAQASILAYDEISWGGITPADLNVPIPYFGPLDLCFHYNHGKNVRVCKNGRTAFRPQPMAEFADAMILSNRPLKTNELFSISIDKMVEYWTGSLEAGIFHPFKIGVTTANPDDVEILPTSTDLDHDLWLLSGSSMTKDGIVIKYGYLLNLDDMKVGSVLGLMRHSDGSLHYYLNDIDLGEACNVPESIYPVVDLYGQCVQVTILNPPETQVDCSSEASHVHRVEDIVCSTPSNQTLFEGPPKCFSEWCGKNITLSEDLTTATRSSHHNHGIVFSNFILDTDKLYEICITKWNGKYAGSMSLGVTTIKPETIPLPPTISCLKPDVWYLNGDEVWHNGRIIKAHYGHNLHWLQCWSTVGVKYCSDGTLHFYVNGQDQGVAASDISASVDLYVVLDLYGSIKEVTINREIKDVMTSSLVPSINIAESFISPSTSATQDTLMASRDRLDDLKAERAIMEYNLQKNFEKEKSVKFPNNLIAGKNWSFFYELKGRNIKLLKNGKTAIRTESYNQGVVIASKPLERDALFEVTIDNLDSRWVSSLMIGILCSPLTRSSVPVTAFGFKRDIWLVSGDCVYHNGNKIKSGYGCNLDLLSETQKIGIMVDSSHQLKLFVDDTDQGIAAANIPPVCYVVLDLYGQCVQVTIANIDQVVDPPSIPLPTELPNRVIRPEPVSCEKADLDRHEKESPSEEDSLSITHLKPDINEGSVSRSKLNKTHENNAVAASYSSESHLKLNKTNENNAVIASNSNPSLINSVTASCSMVDFHAQHVLTSLTSSSSSTSSVNVSEEFDTSKNSRKSLSVSEHSALQPAESQHTDLTRHLSSTNCDHKTSLDIANTLYIQAEKSSNKVKNNKNRTPSPLNERPLKQNPNCEYRLRCCRFRNFLGLPAAFFASETSILCYCTSCCPYVSHEMKGDPPSSYSLPNGWCKFPLKKHLMTNNVDAVTLEKWHVAFVGVSVGNIRRILDSGQLLAPDKLIVGFAHSKENKIKDDDNDKCQILLSPLIKYASIAEFASRYEYIDQKTKTPYSCCAAFQVLVRPGSYKVGPPSLNISSKIDHIFNINTIEWVVKEKESTVLSALLFKIENS